MDYKVNVLQIDDFGRPSGILAINKPVDITSHDVVYKVRKALNTRAVGHAGALDPFATGLIIIMVGKATKLADKYIAHDKEYKAKILFGISTDSADTEGKITQVAEVKDLQGLADVLSTFIPEYDQYVPVFSSVKVNGQKLRELARKYDSFELNERDGKRFVVFHRENDDKEVELPIHHCRIPKMELLGTEKVNISEMEFGKKHIDELKSITTLQTADVLVACSKGTYIRALAEDIGTRMEPKLPAMLIGLERTRVGEISIDQALEIDEIGNLISQPA
jgi:tRNA pseudouridine55 synthase